MSYVIHPGDSFSSSARLRLIIVLGALTALGPLTVDMYLPAFPAVAATFNVSSAAIQATLAGTTIGIAVGQILMGPWSDRVGRRLPLLIATSVHVLASLVCAAAPDIAVLIAARVLSGAAAAAGGVVAVAMVRDLYSGVPMMRMSSRLAMINGVAPILAPVIGSAVLLVAEWRSIFVVLAAYAVLIVAATAALIPETLPPQLRSGGGLRAFLVTARGVLSDRVFLLLMIVGGMVWGNEFTYLAGSSFLLQENYGFSAAAYGLVFAINAVGFVAGSQVAARVAHRIPPSRVLVASTVVLLLASIAFTLLVAGDYRPGALVAMWITVAAVGVSVPASGALALNRVTRNAGTAAALLGAANFGIAGLVTPLASLGPGMGLVMVATSGIAATLAIVVSRMPVGWPASGTAPEHP